MKPRLPFPIVRLATRSALPASPVVNPSAFDAAVKRVDAAPEIRSLMSGRDGLLPKKRPDGTSDWRTGAWKKLKVQERKAIGADAIMRLKGFLPPAQAAFTLELIRTSEERDFYIEKMLDLAERVGTMPATRGQAGKGEQAIAYLRYFYTRGDFTWWITEKDIGHPDDSPEDFQSQAFGLAYCGEYEIGYISIAELMNTAFIELDYHFEPTTLAEIRKKESTAADSDEDPA